jgi:putative tricarboxylic transport membrane protein
MIVLLLGVLSGVVAGLLPGVGVFVTMITLYPFLIDLSFIDLTVFYIALVSTTQYIGSVTATYLGIPGESSSLPAVIEGNSLHKKGYGSLAISGAALGSLLGAFLTLGLIISISSFLPYLYFFYNSYAQFIIFFGIILYLIFTSKSGWFIASALSILAFYLSSIGCVEINQANDLCNMPFNNVDLTTGLPVLSVICAVYVFPQLLKVYKPSKQQKEYNHSLVFHIKYFINNIYSSIRGTVIGFFLGFTPGSSNTLSSNTAYRNEVLIQTKKKKYEEGNYNALIASESANNAAAFTTLLPLFIIGIPISASELLFYDMIMLKGLIFSQHFDISFFMTHIATNLVIINLIAFFIAWPLSKFAKYLYYVPQILTNISVFILLCFAVYQLGSSSFQELYYLTVFLLFLPVGFLFRNIDTLPFVFVFLLQDRMYSLAITTSDLLNLNIF